MTFTSLADVDLPEMVDEIFPRHPECAVVLSQLRLQNSLDILRPEVAFLWPGSIPVELAPVISDLEKFMRIQRFDRQNCVGVARNQRIGDFGLILRVDVANDTWSGSAQQVSFLKVMFQDFEQFVVLSQVSDVFWW